MNDHMLYDSDTGEEIGPATDEQVEASDESEAKGENGHILIDSDGDVVPAGCQAYGPTRHVYTQ